MRRLVVGILAAALAPVVMLAVGISMRIDERRRRRPLATDEHLHVGAPTEDTWDRAYYEPEECAPLSSITPKGMRVFEEPEITGVRVTVHDDDTLVRHVPRVRGGIA